MLERRKYIRIPENVRISYKCVSDLKGSDFFTRNISGGGLRFYIHDFLPVNSIVKIRVTLNKIHFSFEALTTVKWVKKDPTGDRYEIGVEFLDISEAAGAKLMEYIRLAVRSPR